MMVASVEALDTAAARLDQVVQGARLAGSALDGVSGSLVEQIQDVASRADDVRLSVVHARDALVQAGL
jgi:hypothetical protein